MFWMCYRDMLVFILAIACDAWLMIKRFVAPLTCKIARWQMTGQPEMGLLAAQFPSSRPSTRWQLGECRCPFPKAHF